MMSPNTLTIQRRPSRLRRRCDLGTAGFTHDGASPACPSISSPHGHGQADIGHVTDMSLGRRHIGQMTDVAVCPAATIAAW